MANNLISQPGVFIAEELEARGWNQRDLAYILKVPETSVGLIISGKRGVTHRMAKALGAAFDVSGDLFINLQSAYDKAMTQEPNPEIAKIAKFFNVFPIREMIRRGWIEDKDASHQEQQLAKFFEVKSPNEIPYLSHAAKKSRYEEMEIPPIQLAWLFRVRQIAKSITVPAYSLDALKQALVHLREMLIAPEEARHVPRILMECGVRFILVERLPRSAIDGVCFWLDDNSPVIGMSMRYDRIDNFWFVLRHEIEHVLRGHGKNILEGMMDAELEGEKIGVSDDLPEEERMANIAATDFCVPSEKLESFITRKHPFFSEKNVVAFSKLHSIHPGLVIGQIQYRIKRYDYLRKLQVKIRQFVLPGSIADGWGQSVPIPM